MVNILTGTPFDAPNRLNHREDEVALEFPSSTSSRARGLLALRAQNWRAAKKVPVNPWSGLNAFRVVIDDDYRTFDFPMYKSYDKIPTTAIILADGSTSFTINWGDGTQDVYTEITKKTQISHTYHANSEYDISISNDIDSFCLYAKTPMAYRNTHVTAIHNIASKSTFSRFFWEGDASDWKWFFAGCSALEHVDMSESSITQIGPFFGDSGRYDREMVNLASIVLPRTLKTLSNRAFFSLKGWTKGLGIDLPDGLVSVGVNASEDRNIFRETPFEYVHLPGTLTEINGMYHFYQCSYPVIVDSVVPPVISVATALELFKGKFYVPDESVDAYRSAQYWSSFASSILPRSAYTGPIGES